MNERACTLHDLVLNFHLLSLRVASDCPTDFLWTSIIGNTWLVPKRRQHFRVSGPFGFVVQKTISRGCGSSRTKRDGGGLLVLRLVIGAWCWVRGADHSVGGEQWFS